jgi:hypothetical protein
MSIKGMAAPPCTGPRHHHPLLHGEHNFPRHKPASHLDFPLPSGMADDAYLETLAEALNLALRLYTPTSSSIRPGSMCTRTTSLAISPERRRVRQRDAMVFDCAPATGCPSPPYRAAVTGATGSS